jgi:hypothetical protein
MLVMACASFSARPRSVSSRGASGSSPHDAQNGERTVVLQLGQIQGTVSGKVLDMGRVTRAVLLIDTPTMIEPLLLTTTSVSTFEGERALTGATGFFFERDARLFLVTCRHVVIDPPSQHFPDRVEVELHSDAANLTQTRSLSILLYRDGKSIWRQGKDDAGEIDVAVIELERAALPDNVAIRAFTPAHLQDTFDEVEVGSSLLVVGFPLGFHDTLHHLPVVRQAAIASSFGLRFQGQGYFLTDARTHRGTSGAPVVLRSADTEGDLPWKLLGVHASRLDIGSRDQQLDESLGLNCAWYADILLTLTEPEAAPPAEPGA